MSAYPLTRTRTFDRLNSRRIRLRQWLEPAMIKQRFIATTRVPWFVFILAAALSMGAADRHMLIVNGQTTEVPVIYVKSDPYVELKALASVLNGSVSSSGSKVALSLPE